MSSDEIYRMHESTLQVLECSGVRVDNEDAMQILSKAGCDLDAKSRKVKIPSHLVEWALRKAPHSFILAGRRGNRKRDIVLDRNRVYFTTGQANLYAFDVTTGERRLATKKDISDAARLSDALPNIDHVHSMFSYSTPNIGLHELDAMLRNTEKPVTCQDYGDLDVAYYIKLAEVAAGGSDELRSRPNMLLYCEPISPLTHGDSHVRAMLAFARARIPVVYIPCPTCGATAPVTLAGALVQSNAEVLSGLVMGQLASPGEAMMYGGINAPFDMRACVRLLSAPQYLLNTLAIAQLARYYRLPVYSQGGASISKTIDFQAVIETTISLVFSMMSGANLVHDSGDLDFAITGSLEMVTMVDEIVSMLRHTLSGFEINDETLAVDVINDVGPGGNYLTQEHTRKMFRKEQWFTDLMDRLNRDAWTRKGSMTYEQRVKEKTIRLLKEHKPESLPDDVIFQMDELVKQAERSPWKCER